MSTLLDIDYNWKQAASQEGVDVAAVSQSFMDQSYGLVANKAKVLFRDPYRLGFEVVHRNEKATKMTGFFAFRVGKTLLYAPVFFVNGEVKPADMLYRGDVKRFVPLTEDWCERLVKSTDQTSGTLVERSRQLQPDSYLHRLAYPQHVKYAFAVEGGEWPSDALDDMLKTAAAAGDPLRPILSEFIAGTESHIVLEKLASLIENSETARTWMVDNYDLAAMAETTKQAAAADTDDGTLSIVVGINKSAAEHFESVAEHGYALIDKRAAKDLRVVTEVDPDEIRTVTTAGQHNVLTADGKPKEVWLFERETMPITSNVGLHALPVAEYYDTPRVLWCPDGNEVNTSWNKQVFYGQNAAQLDDPSKLGVSVGSVKKGETYLFLNAKTLRCFGPVCVKEVAKDGESRVISLTDEYGSNFGSDLIYTPDRTSSSQYISDEYRALPAATRARKGCCDGAFEPVWTTALMSPDGLKDWIYSAGGIAESEGLAISKDRQGDVFDITHEKMKMAGVSRMEAHARMAAELDISADAAGSILDKAEQAGSGEFRLWSPPGYKSAFTTRVSAMAPWMKTQDSKLGVTVDTPQQQVLSTYTPQRRRQVERFGDHYQGPLAGKNGVTDEDSGLPGDALFTMQPEQLAEMAAKYDMPHVFDHGAFSSLAESDANTLDQVRQYIPDLEQGVDRCFRILFLLRYRPADFEEAYGRDEMLEMESEMAQLAQLSGSNLLRLLKRFDAPTTGA